MKEQIIEILYDSLNEFARNLTKYDYNKTAEKILNLLTEDGYKKMTNTWCAYCGKEFPLDTVTADQVGEHIQTCEKHPLFQANKEIVRLREGWTHCAYLCLQYEKRITELEGEKKNL